MDIVVVVKLVPDLVEEIEIAEDGKSLDMEWLRLIINEFDDHALEQAILIKEQTGANITVISPELEGVDDILYTAAAKGADRLIKMVGEFEEDSNNHAFSRALSGVIKDIEPDLVLIGVQANNDLDGAAGPMLAELLGFPYVGYISGLSIDNGKAISMKEYPGGLGAEMEVNLPAVIGIQAAEEPPRYVAISKVRQAMKTSTIEEIEVVDLDNIGGADITSMYLPESGDRAIMIEGDEEEVAGKLVQLFKELGVM